MWPAIITAAGKLGGDIYNAISGNKAAKYNAQLEADTNKWITEQNIKSARDLTSMQNEYNTEMWNKQNAYNDPSNQAALYERAGFNKQAVLGQFSSSAASAQGSAGIMPDFSAGNGGAKKAAFVLPQLGEYVTDFINVLDKIEQHKQAKLATEMDKEKLSILSDEAAYSNGFFKNRANLILQDYILRGGDLKVEHGDLIRNNMLKNLTLRNELLSTQRDMLKSEYSNYNKYGSKMLGGQLQQLYDKNWLFRNIEKPYQESFGKTFRVLDGAVGVFGRALGSFLKLPFFK